MTIEHDLRRMSVVLVGAVPWVYNSISHQFGVSLSLGCLGHTASQLRPDLRAELRIDLAGRIEENMKERGRMKGRRGVGREITYKKYPAAHNPPATMNDRG